MRAAIAEASRDRRFRGDYADLRDLCVAGLDPKTDLVVLLAQHVHASGLVSTKGNPLAAAIDGVLCRLPPDLSGVGADEEPAPTPEAAFLVSGLEALLDGGLAKARVLDLRAGTGDLVAELLPKVRETFAFESRLLPYYRASARLASFDGLAFAHPLALPPCDPTPALDLFAEENADRLRRIRETPVDAIVGDLRGVKDLPRWVRWAAARLLGDGVFAFVSDVSFVDEPSLAEFRAELERTFDLVAHVAGVSFLVRRKALRRSSGLGLLYADERAERYEATPWRELRPTRTHVWRPEILRSEWSSFVPFTGPKGLFQGSHEGVRGKATLPDDRRARTVLKRPFVRIERRPERGVAWPEGPMIVVAQESFGVFVTDAAPDRRCAGPVLAFTLREIAMGTLMRLRARYGPGLTERDAFDYAVALLHHPLYRERYREDLRRSVPRLPLLEGLDALGELEEAPPVGPGTAFGIGWSAPDLFAPGTIPDYDDPFASPYARADVEPGFLLFAGLGAAIVRTQTQYRDLILDPLTQVVTGNDSSFDRLRLSRDRTRVTVNPTFRLEGVPSETLDHRIGAKSMLEWVVLGLREGTPASAARLVGQVVAMSLETTRLAGVLEVVEL